MMLVLGVVTDLGVGVLFVCCPGGKGCPGFVGSD
jgi:hypothetical protein